jgi:hypothetical protein
VNSGEEKEFSVEPGLFDGIEEDGAAETNGVTGVDNAPSEIRLQLHITTANIRTIILRIFFELVSIS